MFKLIIFLIIIIAVVTAFLLISITVVISCSFFFVYSTIPRGINHVKLSLCIFLLAVYFFKKERKAELNINQKWKKLAVENLKPKIIYWFRTCMSPRVHWRVYPIGLPFPILLETVPKKIIYGQKINPKIAKICLKLIIIYN